MHEQKKSQKNRIYVAGNSSSHDDRDHLLRSLERDYDIVSNPDASLDDLLDLDVEKIDVLLRFVTKEESRESEQLRKEYPPEDLSIILLSEPSHIGKVQQAAPPNVQVLEEAPNIAYLRNRLHGTLDAQRNRKLLSLIPEGPADLLLASIQKSLSEGRVDDCIKPLEYLCLEYPDAPHLSERLFDFIRESVRQGVTVPGLEVRALSTEQLFDMHGLPAMLSVFGGLFKRYRDKKRAESDLVAHRQLTRRMDAAEKALEDNELKQIYAFKATVRTARLLSDEFLGNPDEDEYYLHMELIRGPTVTDIAPDIRAAIDTNDSFGVTLHRAINYELNFWLGALHADPLKFDDIKPVTYDYAAEITTMIGAIMRVVDRILSPSEEEALSLASSLFNNVVDAVEWLPYSDYVRKNVMLDVDGDSRSRLADVYRSCGEWCEQQTRSGHPTNFQDVTRFLREKALVKIDWNKTSFRKRHPADDARHEDQHLPLTFEESEQMNIHWLISRELHRYAQSLESDVLDSSLDEGRSIHLASEEFIERRNVVRQLYEYACAIADPNQQNPSFEEVFPSRAEDSSFIQLDSATREFFARNQKLSAEFDLFERGSYAVWVARLMRTCSLTLEKYLPVVRERQQGYRQELNRFYRSKTLRKELHGKSHGVAIQQRIAKVLELHPNYDDRPFIDGPLFGNKPKEDPVLGTITDYVLPDNLDDYVSTLNLYFRNSIDASAYLREVRFDITHASEILDKSISRLSSGLSDGNEFVAGIQTHDPDAYIAQIKKMSEGVDEKELSIRKQLAGAVYVSHILDQIPRNPDGGIAIQFDLLPRGTYQ